MEILEGILTRRSIRKYTDQIIDRNTVEKLIQYGMYAPSACNRQPWHFVLLNEPEAFEKIMGFHPYAQMLSQAQWGIVVCGDEQSAHTPEYWPVDCAAATQNILLAAHGMGIGSVWLGIYPRPDRISAMKELLNLPQHIHAFSLISIGYPGQQIAPPERVQPSRIHLNKWS